MRPKREVPLLIFLSVLFVGITVGLFVPDAPRVPLFSLFLLAILGIQSLGKNPAAFMLTGFTTLIGIFLMTEKNEADMLALPLLLVCLWGSSSLMYVYTQRLAEKKQKRDEREDEESKQSRILNQEISFYEKRREELSRRAEQRRFLSKAARELGSLLNPDDIQQKLIESARTLFSGKNIHITVGQNNDPVDLYINQKRTPLLIPNNAFKGNPMMAAPIMAQGQVAGVLRVGGEPGGTEYSRDDLRLLDILASLASSALANMVLFNQVQETALRDGLTGLLTHKAFSDQLEAEILQASRYGQTLSVILTDVDHFKSVNDTYGHQAGDQVLQGFAHVMVRNVRDVDIVSRYGGEEFIVLLLQTTHAEAVGNAERIRQDLEAQRFDVGGKIISITGSFGVATFPKDATSAQQLVRVADERMYAAKKAGRNQVIGKAA